MWVPDLVSDLTDYEKGLDLANDARTLVYEDTVIRHSEGTTSMTTSNSDIKMMLFDHYRE